jgi:thiosulfate dehydrogenase [quinone] large subunit
MRLAFYGGAVLNLIFWTTVLPPEFNPLIDEHIIYIGVLFILERMKAGDHLGLGEQWSETSLVKRFPILK